MHADLRSECLLFFFHTVFFATVVKRHPKTKQLAGVVGSRMHDVGRNLLKVYVEVDVREICIIGIIMMKYMLYWFVREICEV